MSHPSPGFILLVLLSLTPTHAQRYPFTRYSTSDGLSENTITALAQDRRGFLWIGTATRGLNRFDGKEFALFDLHAAGIPGAITALATDGGRYLFVGTTQGLRCLSLSPHAADEQEHAFDRLFDRIKETARRISVQRNGELYIETAASAWLLDTGHRTLRSTERESDRFFSIRNAVAGDTVRDALRDATGRWWVATDRGILRIDRSDTLRLHRRNGLAADHVNVLLSDDEGAIWCGTDDGLFRHVPDACVVFVPGNGLPDRCREITRIVEDGKGEIWLGTGDGGLARIGPPSRPALALYHAPMNRRVNDVIVRDDDQLVLARPDGLTFVHGGTSFTLAARDGLPADSVHRVIPSMRGGYWASTAHGLALILADSITVFTERDGLPSDCVTQTAEDAYGDLWIGTDAGACMLSRTANNRVYPIRELNGVHVTAVFIDARNYPWFGTVGSGAYCYIEGRLLHMTRDDGLAGNTVQFFAQDRYGSMYFGTNGGVTVLPENNRQFFIPYDTISYQWGPAPVLNTYLRMTGMYTLAPAGDSSGNTVIGDAALVDTRGDLWFAGAGNVTRWTPIPPSKPASSLEHTARPRPAPREILLTRIRIGEREVPVQSRVTLAGDEEIVRAQVAFPTFRSRNGSTFLYRLEHFESAWHVSSDGSILYTGLGAGEYVLLVTATSGDGKWARPRELLWIVKRAPFQETLWFWLIIALVAGGAGAAAQRWRAKRRKDEGRRMNDA